MRISRSDPRWGYHACQNCSSTISLNPFTVITPPTCIHLGTVLNCCFFFRVLTTHNRASPPDRISVSCCFFIMSPLSVRRWIESLEPRPIKRRRCDLDDNRDASDDDFTHPYNTPSTPSPTDSSVDMPRNTRGRKRAGDALGDDDDLASSIPSNTPQLLQDTTPKLLSTLPKPSSSTSSSKRLRSTSPIKSRLDLQLLEKPVQIRGLEGDITGVLPADIQSLYTQL